MKRPRNKDTVNIDVNIQLLNSDYKKNTSIWPKLSAPNLSNAINPSYKKEIENFINGSSKAGLSFKDSSIQLTYECLPISAASSSVNS